ncbi:GNAT family N-acetyltransferase [Streptomyces sp. NPDC018031]|uniref:GNAT family N-acetyltransferase n=1 Tax=Streptomyces sp. NPDC018031 TaxID=3365033 RepID=UPI003792812D
MDDLVTERLILHPMTVAEAERVVAGLPGDTDRWAPGYPDVYDVKGARDFLTACAGPGNPQPFGTYEIRRREDGRAIGGLGFNRPPDAAGTTVIGYALIPSVRGRGYATEALRGLLEFARAAGVRRVTGDTDHDNTASQRVMAAAGMRPAGEDERVRYYAIDWAAAPPS